MFDAHKSLVRCLALQQPVSGACFLNSKGDVIAATGCKLYVSRASVYGRYENQQTVRAVCWILAKLLEVA